MSKEIHNEPNDITQKVMSTIKNEDITMHSKSYFIAGSILTITGITIALTTALISTALFFFKLRADSPFDYLRHGFHGVTAFFDVFPWIIFAIAVGFTVLGLKLLRKYEYSYQYKHISIAIGMLFAVIIFGNILDQVNVHRSLQTLRPIQHIYTTKEEGRGLLVGKIYQDESANVYITTPSGKTFKVYAEQQYISQDTFNRFSQTQHVRLTGFWDKETFYVTGISVAPSPHYRKR